MKRIIGILMLITIITSACGCQSNHYGIVPFENKNVMMECNVNDKFDVIIKKENDTLSLEAVKPSEIKGLTFVFGKTESYAVSSETKIPIAKESYKGIFAIASILNIKEEMSLSVTSSGGNGIVEFLCDTGKYTLIYDNDGYLVGATVISEDYRYDIVINGLKIL